MIKKIYYILAVGVIGIYAISAWSGWEFANAGQTRSIVGVPFVSGGFRGGK